MQNSDPKRRSFQSNFTNVINFATDVSLGVCGDGLRTTGEICDDSNLADGDGCSSACVVEENWECVGGTALTADVCTGCST